jgi:hypothetical protein
LALFVDRTLSKDGNVSNHLYRVGQVVRYTPGRAVSVAAAREYKVLRLLPAEHGENQYRIKSIAELFERIAQERDLSAK